MKVEEVQLLTKKIMENEVVVAKMERSAVMKDKLIE
jgi:hypothetical protein